MSVRSRRTRRCAEVEKHETIEREGVSCARLGDGVFGKTIALPRVGSLG